MMSFEEMAALDAFLIKRIQDAQEEFKRTASGTNVFRMDEKPQNENAGYQGIWG